MTGTTLGLAASLVAACGVAATTHHDAVALRNCLALRKDYDVLITPFRNGDAGAKLPQKVAHKVYVAIFVKNTAAGRRLVATVFIIAGRNTAEATKLRSIVRRAIAHSLVRDLPYRGGGTNLNISWLILGGRDALTVSSAINACLKASIRR